MCLIVFGHQISGVVYDWSISSGFVHIFFLISSSSLFKSDHSIPSKDTLVVSLMLGKRKKERMVSYVPHQES